MSAMNPRIRVYVAAVVLLGIGSFVAAWPNRSGFPGWWPFATFLVAAAVLEGIGTRMRGAVGSVAFVMHLASTLLFGGFWGAVVTCLSNLLGNLSRGNEPLKALFNASQVSISVLVGAAAYGVLGGSLPPSYLSVSAHLASQAVQKDLGLFFVMAAVYFVINSSSVSGAVALSSGRTFREIWNTNNRGVLGYDLAASGLAVLVAWLYTRFDQTLGFGSVSVIGIVLPIVAVRHVYGLYRQLQESGQELLQLMVKAIEARDPYTSGHSVRVSALSRAIAVELDLSADQVEQIETAALLHDVGKIHEEFAPLLRKESRLSDSETALMQTHSAKSADLVGLISKFRGPIQEAVRHHHERWDGKGYPASLSGEKIPLGARIILISDTVDAMTTDRPYRKRLTLDAVIAELQRCKGTQFDSRLVDVAISSVAVRRLIAEPSQAQSPDQRASLSSRRLSWPTSRPWRAQRA